jgi:hypothetical protein
MTTIELRRTPSRRGGRYARALLAAAAVVASAAA